MVTREFRSMTRGNSGREIIVLVLVLVVVVIFVRIERIGRGVGEFFLVNRRSFVVIVQIGIIGDF